MLKYEIIREDLKDKIRSGIYPFGTMLPAERKLCEIYEVQRQTVRKALADLKSMQYIESLHGTGNKVIYRPKEPDTPEPRMLAFLISGEMDREAQLYHIQVCNYLEEYLRPHHIHVLFAKIGSGEETPAFLEHQGNVAGIICVSEADDHLLHTIRQKQLPCLLIASGSTMFPKIQYADFEAGFAATKHLLEKGSRRIAYISGIRGSVNDERLRGYKEALATYGIHPKDDWIIAGDWSYRSGEIAGRLILESETSYDGILAGNDMTAIGALKALLAAGKRIPEDVRLIGIDNINEGKSCVPALTTISFSQQDVARTASLFILELMGGRPVPEQILIPGRLIERHTT